MTDGSDLNFYYLPVVISYVEIFRMKKNLLCTLLILISTYSFAQNPFLLFGRDLNDLYYYMDEYTDSGIVFYGQHSSNYNLLKYNSNFDSLWNVQSFINNTSQSDFCVLSDGNFGVAGYSDPTGYMPVPNFFVFDSNANYVTSFSEYPDDAWGGWGERIFPSPDSGICTLSYTDGYTCDNFYTLTKYKNNSSVWTKFYGACINDYYFGDSYNFTSYLFPVIYTFDGNDTITGNYYQGYRMSALDTADSEIVINEVVDPWATRVMAIGSDSSFILSKTISINSNIDLLLVKFSKTGLIQWSDTFGTAYNDYPESVVETADHGVALLTSKLLPYQNTPTDVHFYKTDSLGNITVTQSYGGINEESAIKLIRKKDNSLLIFGRTESFLPKRNFVIRLNADGSLAGDYTVQTSSSNYCIGDTATLTVNPQGTNYLWSNGATTQQIRVMQSGNYSVQVTDSSGQIHNTLFIPVYFNSPPDVAVVDTPLADLCLGNSTAMSVNYNFENNYSWYQDGNLIDTAQLNYYPVTQTGNYRLIVSNACGLDSTAVFNVTVHPLPALPVLSHSPSNHTCFTSPMIVSSSVPGGTIQWQMNYGSPFIYSDSLVLTASGMYTIRYLAIDNFGCMSALQYDPVVVDSFPSVNILDTLVFQCPTGTATIHYHNNANYGIFTTWFNDTLLGTSTYLPYPVNELFTHSGIFKMVMSNSCGMDSDSVNVTKINYIDVNIFPDTPKICMGTPINIFCLSPSLSYWWYPPGSSYENITVSTGGSYNLIIRDPYTHCQLRKDFLVLSDSLHFAPIINNITNSLICQGNQLTLSAGNFPIYHWSNNTTASSVTYFNPGIIDTLSVYVTVIDTNGCSATDSALIYFDLCAQIKSVNSDKEFYAFPNPSSGKLNIHYPENCSSGQLTIYNDLGQIIYSGFIYESEIEIKSSGIFYLKFIDGENISTETVILN